MGKEARKSGGVSRRKFVKGAGIAVAGGVVGGIVGDQLIPSAVEAVQEIGKSGVIQWDPDKCAACSRCMMACAAYHESAVAPQLSRIKWQENDYLYGFRFRRPIFCNQCDQPECYYACPEKDTALSIDDASGARYINRSGCIGCGSCVEACPFEVSRINFDKELNKAIKCDLCKDRSGGPVCVEVCDRGALTLLPKEGR